MCFHKWCSGWTDCVKSQENYSLELSFVALETGKMNGKEATELSTNLFFSWDIVE